MAFKERALELLNSARSAHGLPPLQPSRDLESVAQDGEFHGCNGFVVRGRSLDMGLRNYFSHAIKDCNQGVFDMLAAAGIVHSGAGENLAFANALDDESVAAERLHNQLMGDAGHLANILNSTFTHVGIGMFRSAPGQVWTGAPGPPPNQPLTRVFITAQVFARNPTTTSTGVGDPSSTGGRFHSVTPHRILDTREALGAPGPLGPGAAMNLQVAGHGGVPASGAAAVVMNVTVTGPDAPSFLTAFPTGEARPNASNLNFTEGRTVANLVVVELGDGGQVTLVNAAGTTQVIADVAGWFDDGTAAAGSGAASFHPVDPLRLLDTRSGNGAPPVALGAGATMNLQVAGRGGVPASRVAAVALNMTVTGPSAAGFLTVFPAGEPRPLASNLNFVPGQTVCNMVLAKLGIGGQVAIFNSDGDTQIVADVAGWFDDGTLPDGALFHPVAPSRILDTRTSDGAPAGPLGAGATLALQVTGHGGVPASGVAAAVMNVTVTQPTDTSFLTVFPTGQNRPEASNLCFTAGLTVPNLVVAKLSTGGQASIFNNAGATHVIADVAGWFDAG
jgi:hypothetical protein